MRGKTGAEHEWASGHAADLSLRIGAGRGI
jgi:hypothetical protein